MNDAAAYGDAGPEVQSAAETLRSVEALRRRGAAMTKARAFPLWVWAGAFLAALPFAMLADRLNPTTVPGEISVVIGGAIDEPGIVFMAIGIAVVVAALATILDYRRQPVHAARPGKRQISVGEAIIIAAALFILGPVVLGAFITIALSHTMVFLAASVLAVIVGSYIGNRTLSVAAVASLFGVILARFASPDHWPAVACGAYVLAFSIGGLSLTLGRRAA